jgi:Zn-dependent oligopeptidase
MKFIDSEDARRRLDFASNNVNAKDNVPLIEKLTEKRQELAELMGYSSYTELNLKDKMAKAPQAVEKLLDDLTQRISK